VKTSRLVMFTLFVAVISGCGGEDSAEKTEALDYQPEVVDERLENAVNSFNTDLVDPVMVSGNNLTSEGKLLGSELLLSGGNGNENNEISSEDTAIIVKEPISSQESQHSAENTAPSVEEHKISAPENQHQSSTPPESGDVNPSGLDGADNTATKSQSLINDSLNLLRMRLQQQVISIAKAKEASQGKTLTATAKAYLSTLQVDGRWQDIDYQLVNDSKQPPQEHLQRLIAIAVVHRELVSQGDSGYQDNINRAFGFWFRESPKVAGWWENVGVRDLLAQLTLILGNQLKDELRNKAINVIAMPNRSLVGLDRAEMAMVDIYYGLLTEDENFVLAGISQIEDVLAKVKIAGSPHDWSTVVTQKLSSGRSAQELFISLTNLAYNVIDLPWKLSGRSSETLASILLDGIRWMESYNYTGDRHSVVPFFKPDEAIMHKIATLVPARHDEAVSWFDYVYKHQATGLKGVKHFWLGHAMVTATADFMLAIQMDSVRSETVAESHHETLSEFWSGLGSMVLTQINNLNDNLDLPLEPAKIPGVTLPEYQALPVYDNQSKLNSEFVGGASNGAVGITTMAINMSEPRPSVGSRDYLKAKKSWFSLGEQIVVLGAGISASHLDPVYTTIEHTPLNGSVTLGNGDNLPLSTLDVQQQNWLYHDNVGYVFLDQFPRTAQLDFDQQSGETLFTLSIPHGHTPENQSYQYVVLPNKTKQKIADYQSNLPVRVLANSVGIQAVEDTTKNIISAVFYQAGELEVSQNYKVKVDYPCVVILDRSHLNTKVTISTPSKAYGAVNLTIIRHGVSNTQRVVTPGSEGQLGRSISFEFDQGQTLNLFEDSKTLQAMNTLVPVEDLFVQGGSTSTNLYGSSGYMQLKNGTGAHERHSLLRYDLSQIDISQLNKATLRLFVRGIKNGGPEKSAIVVRLVNTSHWSELITSFNTYPTIRMTAESAPVWVGMEVQKQWIEIDVTSVIRYVDNNNKSEVVLELADLTDDYKDNYISFATREFGYKGPHLIVE